ncbi:hypothetical protein lerEdw1_007335 [Lerista edwardsae]|nr:hypothetical protein lerEdw1_007335 [Lerista edwardsae]
MNVSELDWLLDYFPENYSSYDAPDSLAEPCHSTYCSVFGGSVPVFLAVAGTLGIASNLLLGLALAKRPRLWGRPHPSKAALCLMTATSALFAAILPFFAIESLHGWVFGDRFCLVAQVLRCGCLFAQGLVLAGSACPFPGHCASCLLPTVLWGSGFLLATPAGKISHSGAVGGSVCVLSTEPELYLWSLAHALFCLAVFLVLPAAMILAQVAGRWCNHHWQANISTAWIFYLLWMLYGVAVPLSTLSDVELFAPGCNAQEHLDYFLGLSEGLGTLHCFLCPLLTLGVPLYRQEADQVSNC